MREKYLWLVIAVLLVLTLGQSCYIYEQRVSAGENSGPPPLQPDIHQRLYSEKSYDAQWEELEKWREKVHGQIGRGDPLLERDFDILFNDRFFSGKFSPFTEIERIRREMSGRFGRSERLLFDGYWDKWFEQRMLMGEFRTDIVRSGRDVTIGINIPGLAEDALDINITDERIKISFSARTGSAEDLPGGGVKSSSSRSYVKILPLPVDAVPGTGKVKVEGERVKIRFDLKNTGVNP